MPPCIALRWRGVLLALLQQRLDRDTTKQEGMKPLRVTAGHGFNGEGG
jgi:hypothetical protein